MRTSHRRATQDELIGTSAAPSFVEDDSWQPATQASVGLQRTALDVEEIPAGSLLGQLDEDFAGPVPAPSVAALWQRLPVGDQDEIPAGSLFGQDDEDFWNSQVAPVQATVYQPLPIGDVEEVPAGSLFGGQDEDIWQSGVAPVAATLYQRLPIGDPEEIPAGALFGQADEDFTGPLSQCPPQAITQTPPWDSAEVVPVFVPTQGDDAHGAHDLPAAALPARPRGDSGREPYAVGDRWSGAGDRDH